MEEKKELQNQDERVVEIELERLRGFVNHPFKVQADSQMIELQESIKKYGILNPLIVRPRQDGTYEIISGHRRKFAAEKIGYRKVPVIIRVFEAGKLTESEAEGILGEIKQKEADRVVFKNEQLYRFFPSTYTSEQMRREILEILKLWRNSNWI